MFVFVTTPASRRSRVRSWSCDIAGRSSIWTAEVAFPKKLIRRIEKQTTVPGIVQTLPLPLGCHLSSRLVLQIRRVWSRSRDLGRPLWLELSGNFLRVSVLGCHDVLVTAHFLQDGGQAVEIAVGEMLRLPQVQNHAGRTRLGGEVVEIPADTRGKILKTY